MSIWLIGLAVTLVSGIVATLYFWLVRRPRDEMSYGLHALSGLRWCEFSKLVLSAMAERGLVEAAPETQESREPQSTFLLARGDERWLLSCKHGSAYRIAAAPVQELAASIRLGAAQGGILATEGKVEKEGRDAAQGTTIELLDGPRLWPEVRHLVEPALREQITHYASSRAKRHSSISWLGAVTLGALAMVAWSGTHPKTEEAAAPAPAAVARPPSTRRACSGRAGKLPRTDGSGTGSADGQRVEGAVEDSGHHPRRLADQADPQHRPGGQREGSLAVDLPGAGALPGPARQPRAAQPAAGQQRTGALAPVQDDVIAGAPRHSVAVRATRVPG